MGTRCACGRRIRAERVHLGTCWECEGRWDGCPFCGRRKKIENKRCRACRTAQQHEAPKWCSCGVFLTDENWLQSSQRKFSYRCKDCLNGEAKRFQAKKGREYYALKRREVKAELMAAYGSKCMCCGETDLAFLTIDHKLGNGADHRREIKSKGGQAFYKWLKERGYPQDDFQCLCMNCNFAKSRNFWGCPHEAAKLKLIA